MGDVRFKRALERLKDSEDPAQELRTLPDPDVIAALAAASPRDEDPRLLNVLATEAQNRARRAATIVNHIAEGVLILDEDGRVTFLNPSAARLLERDPGEVIGWPEEEVLSLVDERGAPIPYEKHLHADVARAENVVVRDSWCLTRSDGFRIPVLLTAAPIVDEGDLIGVILTLRDITERRAAEEALRASEERYRLLAESATDIVSRSNAEGLLEYVSPACRTMLGYEPHEMLGRSFTDFAHPDDAAESQRQRPTPPHDTWTSTLRVRRRDGQWLWIETRARALRDAAGRVHEIIAISRDLTERVQTETRLRESERHLDEAQQLAHVGSWEWDVESDEFVPSTELLRLAGLPASRRVLKIREVLELMPKPDRLGVVRATEAALLHPGPYAYEHRIVRPDGSLRHLHCRADVLVDGSGRARRVIGTALDVTDLKVAESRLRESERRYRFLAEHARDLVAATTTTGRIVYVSPSARRLLGYDPTDMLGRDAFEFVAPEDHARLRSLPGPDRLGPDGCWRVEARVVHRNGGRIWVESIAEPVRDRDTGRFTQIVCVVRDITPWKRSLDDATQRVEALEARAQELEGALREAAMRPDRAHGGASES